MKIITSIICSSVLAFATWTPVAAGQPTSGHSENEYQVDQVQSADSITFKTQLPVSASDQNHFKTLRFLVVLTGVAAPTLAMGPCFPGQPFAEEARKRVQDLLIQKTVKLQSCHIKHPRTNIQSCEILLGQGTLNAQLVSEGLAWSVARDPKLDQLQVDARAARLGLWSDAEPLEPSVWVDKHWPKRSPKSNTACM